MIFFISSTFFEAIALALIPPSLRTVSIKLMSFCNLLISIEIGEIFSKKNLGVKRPGNGVSPFRFWEYLGQPAQRKYDKDEMILPE